MTRRFSAPILVALALALVLVLGLPTAAPAQGVVSERNISLNLAWTIAEAALSTCRQNGFHVSVAVVDRSGEVRFWLRDDDARPHTFENSRRKAYTARTIGMPSGEFAKLTATEPARAAQATLPHIIALAGALPIKVGDEIIGAVGVSGSPGGDKDEACAKAGIDKVADQLK
jgi:uncharacterized protein GlcG (DUF336 family)